MHPQTAVVTALGQIPSFADPAAIGAARPRIAEMDGRVVVFQPLKIEHGVPGPNYAKDGKVQDRITADIIVIDGGDLTFGGAPEKGVPHSLVVATPYLATGCYVSQVNLVTALTPHINQGVVLGRIGRGVARGMNNPPWNLYPLTTDASDRAHIANAERQGVDPAALAQRNAQARQAVQAFYAAKIAGTWANPTPRPIAGAPAPSTAHTYAASVTPSAPVTYTQTNFPHSVTAAPEPPPPGYDPGVWANLSEDVRAHIRSAIAATAPALPPPPPGWAPEMWESLTDAQREQILLATSAADPAAPPNPF